MAEPDKSDPAQKRANKSFDWMIPLAGIVLVLFATAMFGLFPNTPNNMIIAIAIFGVGCGALWFGLVHSDAHKTQDRIDQLNQRADKVKDFLDKTRK